MGTVGFLWGQGRGCSELGALGESLSVREQSSGIHATLWARNQALRIRIESLEADNSFQYLSRVYMLKPAVETASPGTLRRSPGGGASTGPMPVGAHQVAKSRPLASQKEPCH